MASKEEDKDTPFGRSGAEKSEEGGKTDLDTPAKPEDDFATDERRKKTVRGPEDHKE